MNYDDIIHVLCMSNIGSFTKEDIMRNNIIEKGRETKYYDNIKNILISKDIGIIKERKLIKFLKKERKGA